MSSTGMGTLPMDWYRSTFSGDTRGLFWEEDAGEKVARALRILRPTGRERVLDLACTSGQRTLELSRRGFGVVGTDVDAFLLEIGACEAVEEDIYPLFVLADPRELDFLREFDLALSLGGGPFGFFDDERDDRLVFQLISQSLRPGGRLLMQTPNVLCVEAHLPERIWLESEHETMLVEQCWERESRCIDGSVMSLIDGELFDGFDPAPFRRRIYSIEELAQIFESVGMELVDVFNADGARYSPDSYRQEIFVEACF